MKPVPGIQSGICFTRAGTRKGVQQRGYDRQRENNREKEQHTKRNGVDEPNARLASQGELSERLIRKVDERVVSPRLDRVPVRYLQDDRTGIPADPKYTQFSR